MIFGVPFNEGGGNNFGIKDIHRIDEKRIIIEYIQEECKFFTRNNNKKNLLLLIHLVANKFLRKNVEIDDETGEKFSIIPLSHIGITNILCTRTLQFSNPSLFNEIKLSRTLKLIKSDVNIIEYNFWAEKQISFVTLSNKRGNKQNQTEISVLQV